MRSHAMTLVAGAAILGLLATVTMPAYAVARVRPAMPSDFNGDGYADLAVGVPYEDLGTKTDAGAVNVLYGSAKGLTAAGDQLWTQDSPGVIGIAEGGRWEETVRDGFGSAVASGDFDGDGYADLAVGVPADRINGEGMPGTGPDIGAVNILYGSARGLTAAGDQRWTRLDLPDVPETHFSFGRTLATGDFDGDGCWDLAIRGTEYLGGDGYAGTVSILYGGSDGLTALGSVVLTQEMAGGMSDSRWEWFGAALAAGDLDGDGTADLAAAASSESGRGAVGVFYGSSSGLTVTGAQLWSQDSPGIMGEGETWEHFGSALAIGDFDGNAVGDLAVAVIGEDVRTASNAGAVNVIYGSSGGLIAAGNQLWHEDVAGVPEVAEASDGFGSALAAGDFDGDGAEDLAIGVSQEAPGGAVVALYGRAGAGLSAVGAQLWTQNSPGVPGSRETPDRFGSALAAANYGRSGRDDLAIGVKHENLARTRYAGMVNVLYGRTTGLSGRNAQGWSQGTTGVRGTVEPIDRFGWALTP